MPRPLCFMVMPYGRKPTLAEAGKGPAEIDFNRLWDLAFVPAIEALGYEPIRADQDTGSLIITQMLERLYFADIVLADMSIPNGNVYYEIGIRHAARPNGCVLLAADWSRQLFDVAQMRTVRYPLPEGEVTEATALAIQQALRNGIPALAGGLSPMHQSIDGYPEQVDAAAATSMHEQLAALASFQAEVRAVRAAPRAERMQRATALAAGHGQPPVTPPVAIALMRLLRDSAEQASDWAQLLDYVDHVADSLGPLAEVHEQRALALSNTGRHLEAIAELETVVARDGPTPERLGLLGGRYKRLLRSAAAAEDQRQAMARAIEHYERGMDLDLNEYYCACNLPRLYRRRQRKGDEERAQTVLRLVIASCERALRRGVTDPWLRPTLLVAAFDAGDADKAEELADHVADDGAARWQIESIVGDLQTSLDFVADAETRTRLQDLIARLKS